MKDGVDQISQACLYKLHHILFVPVWRKNNCGKEVFDPEATFRPVGSEHRCRPGTGKWRTVVFGSLYVYPPVGKREYGEVKSLKDISLKNCN